MSREVLADMLRQHGEDGLARRALSVSDEQLARIGTLAAYYAFSEDAMALGGSMGGSRALSLAALDVLEATGRDLRLSRPEAGAVDLYVDIDVVRDRELRRHAAARQIPADRRTRTLDIIDPPAWGPAPPGATPQTRRCHELRTTPLVDLTDDDLCFMLDQGVVVSRLVSLAIRRLRAPPAHGDASSRELLASVLRVDATYWERSPDPDVSVRIITEHFEAAHELEPELRQLVDAFRRDHSARRRSHWNGLTA